MTQYHRTLGGQVTNALPAWRAAMTSTLTVYPVGPSNVDVAARLLYTALPGGVVPAGIQIDCTTGDPASLQFSGWNDSVVVPGVGAAHGKVLYFGAGEGYWGNYSMAFDLTTGSIEKWQDHYYCTTSAQAASEDADAYYSPTDAAAMSSTLEVVDGGGTAAAWHAAWVTAGKPFPVKWQNWVIRRKFNSYAHGSNRHYVGRYDAVEHVPASMTGTGNAAVVINGQSWRGPFGGGPTPGGGANADWHEVVGSQGPRSWVFWQDVVTKEWGRSATRVPDGLSGGVQQQASLLDEANKRIYWLEFGAAVHLWYTDISSGMAAMTHSSVTNLTAGGPDLGLPGERGSWILTKGHPGARRLAFAKPDAVPFAGARDNYLAVVDIDASTYTTLGPIPSLAIDSGSERNLNYGIDYVPEQGAYGTLILTTSSPTNGVRMHLIPLPADPTVAANYSGVTNTTLSLAAGLTLDATGNSPNVKRYGRGKGGYLRDLGAVLFTQNKGPLLAYRPF